MKEVINMKEAIKEARELYATGGINEEWTQKEFINDYLAALEEDGYELV